ncbi:hypothetical protein B0H67DRAFT_641315 [Lasiosphaeris hirsuta]|uniref:Uncharacterized protein n=1 Tax=Lasiosphaeris hirsuta TaxID=260670 RepID=A0AA40AZE5_9PEZI|nr:hypothetical protein B0H67DRAFT_641315 [Lasiosphaeris hirsuta]
MRCLNEWKTATGKKASTLSDQNSGPRRANHDGHHLHQEDRLPPEEPARATAGEVHQGLPSVLRVKPALVKATIKNNSWSVHLRKDDWARKDEAMAKAKLAGILLQEHIDWITYAVEKVPNEAMTLEGPKEITEIMVQQEAKAADLRLDYRKKAPPEGKIPLCEGCYGFHWKRGCTAKPVYGRCGCPIT